MSDGLSFSSLRLSFGVYKRQIVAVDLGSIRARAEVLALV